MWFFDFLIDPQFLFADMDFPVKVTVRRLPHSMSREVFEGLLGRLDEACPVPSLLYFVEGFAKSRGRQQWARAYLVCVSPRAAELFHAAFEGGWSGWQIASSVAPLVEPSPYQRIRRGAEREDQLMGTLDDYVPFKEFAADRAKERQAMPSADVQMERRAAAAQRKPEVIMSPLLLELTAKKVAQFERDRERQRPRGPQSGVRLAQRPREGGKGQSGGQSQSGGQTAGGQGGGGGGKRRNRRGPRRQGGGGKRGQGGGQQSKKQPE